MPKIESLIMNNGFEKIKPMGSLIKFNLSITFEN